MPATLDWYGCATVRLTVGNVDGEAVQGTRAGFFARPAALHEVAKRAPRTELAELAHLDGHPLFT